MTIQNNYVPVKAKGNGSTVNFSFTWPALSVDFIEVYLEDIATGVQTKQTSGTDYNVTSSDESGGVISFVTAPSSSYNVIIARNVPITQEKPYTTSKGFEGNEIEKSFDKDVAINQQQEENLKRTVKAPLGTQNFDGTLPPLSAGKAVIIKDDLTGLELSKFKIDDVGALTQEAKDAAESSKNSAIDANNAASAAAGSATSAAQSAERAKDKFKGEWNPSYPNGYMIGDTVLYNATQWESSIDNNTTKPPEESSGISSSWKLFLPGSKGSDEYVADAQEATFKGDGVTKEFNLTQKNPLLKPTSVKQILFVEVDNVVLSELNYTIKTVNNDSIIDFYNIPPAIVDGDYNIIVRGVTPKIIADYETRIAKNTADITNLQKQSITGYFHVRDQKATGSHGGTSVSGTQTRQLNTIVPNPTGTPTISGASLANNRVTLPAGTYEIKGYAPSITSRGTRAIVHNITDSQDLLIGTSAFIDAGGEYGNTYSFVEGMITLDGTKELVLNHSIETGRATFGLGYRANRAPYEVYAYLIIKKLGD